MKRMISAYLVSFLLLLGTGLMLYPSVASWKSQWDQSQLIDTYGTRVDRAQPEKTKQLEHAHRYNEALSAGAVLGVNERIPSGTGEVESVAGNMGVLPYAEQLTLGEDGLMARIRIPSIDVDLPIYHGSTDDVLLKGAGHLEGTSLPVGGTSTRTVITAHRGLASATMFTNLDKVKRGDTFTIETFGETLTYRVESIKVVEPDESEEVLVEEGRDLATLITCTPLGINSHRILVTGERVLPTPAKDLANAGKASELPRFPTWAIIIGVVIILAVPYSAYETRVYVKSRREKTATDELPPSEDLAIHTA
ncbi:MAG: class C sortase [Actinomycetaceae bacterium]|nr:class C sortase [Arcanobacterium sp.]MDD7504545.1 class C sortase [Actinomycetaceae bacterium]MDY6143188.1 class C sortase [Arcanobacterium sp.]